MKKIILLLSLFGIILNNNAQDTKISNLSSSARPTSGDLFVVVDGGTTKKLLYDSLALSISDSIGNARADLADTATAIRASMSAANAGWTKTGNHIYATSTGDSIGIGTSTVDARLKVAGVIEAVWLRINDGYNNFLITGHETVNQITGTYNSVLGYGAGQDMTTGANNTLMGYGAGGELVDGAGNTYIGMNAGNASASTYSNSNVYIGAGAGYDNDGGYNTCIGTQAMNGADTSWYNICIGYRAGYVMDDADDNVIIGTYAGDAITDGDYNICIGTNAGGALTTASGAVNIGYDAGKSQTTQSANVYIGLRAGEDNTGNSNSGIGYLTMNAATGVDNCVSLGTYSLGSLTTGDNTVAIGPYAGYLQTTVSGCVYLGYRAGYKNTSANTLYIDNDSSARPLIYGNFVNGSEEVVINGNSTDNGDGYTFYVNGTAGGADTWNSLSDARLKKKVEPIRGALRKVMHLKGVTYIRADIDTSRRRMGFIAQESFPVVPEVVNPGNDTVMYSMQLAPITALLVEAMKAQQRQLLLMKILMVLMAAAFAYYAHKKKGCLKIDK